jgi:hypothetical protein
MIYVILLGISAQNSLHSLLAVKKGLVKTDG